MRRSSFVSFIVSKNTNPKRRSKFRTNIKTQRRAIVRSCRELSSIAMAYIPPHKRHSKDGDAAETPSSPRPELLTPLFDNNLKFRSSRSKNVASQRSFKIVYGNKAVSRWFAVGFDDRDQFPSSVRLRPVSFESVERKVSEKPLALIYTDPDEESSSEVRERVLGSPWIYIAENVVRDLVSSFENVRNEIETSGNEELKPTLVARFGKIIFRSSSSLKEESMTEDLACEDKLRQLKRSFNTNIPKSYMKYIVEEGALKIGVELEGDKDVYHVKLSDTTRPDSILSCRCRVLSEDGKLQLYKIELNQVRHMVMDISCLEKNVDLRLMLCTKRIINDLTEDDMKNIRDLIDSAVIDNGVKGGLRWSLGKATSGDKFSVCGSWHTKTKTYVNPSMKLKVRDADRFNFTTSTGESSREIVVKLKKLASDLKERDVDQNLIKEMLKDNLRVLWESFFCCESFLKW